MYVCIYVYYKRRGEGCQDPFEEVVFTLVVGCYWGCWQNISFLP